MVLKFIIATLVGVTGVSGKGLVTGILYVFGIDNGIIILETIIVNSVWVATV